MKLKDIADEVGVSVSTVSRVINGKGDKSASKEIQDRIWTTVRSHGYTPNEAARALKSGSSASREPGLSIACLFARGSDPLSDPFFTSLSRCIEENAMHLGHLVKYTLSSVDMQHQQDPEIFKDNHISGVVILGRCDAQLLQQIRRHISNVAYVGLNKLNLDFDQIICDGSEAGITAVRHLIQLNHSKIAYMGECRNESRFLGYRTAMMEGGCVLRNDYVFDVNQSMEGGYHGAEKLLSLQDKPTAVFCANDVTAIGLLRKLREAGVHVPEDISVISIDDIEMSRYLSPALTTVSIPIHEIGYITTKILFDRIQRGHKLPMRIYVPFKLVERETCGPCIKKR